MTSESIFSFLKKDIYFKEVHGLCLELEKAMANELYRSSLQTSRIVIEGLLKIIVLKDKEDNKLSKELYGKKNPKTGNKIPPKLSEVLYKCVSKKYISSSEYNLLKRHVDRFGNDASHFNEKQFNLENAKKGHKLIFDFALSTYQRFDKRFEKEYSFDLSYLEKGNDKYFTKEEFSTFLEDIKINEVSTEGIIKEIEEKGLFLSVDQLKTIIGPMNEKIKELEDLDNNQYLSSDEVKEILSNYDKSLKEDILKDIEETQRLEREKIEDILNGFKEGQITITEINELIEENNEELQSSVLNSIKLIVKDIIKESLKEIIDDMRDVPIIDDGKIIDVPEYQVVETEEEEFEIREIEEIIGVPELCPKCKAKIRKGATRCDNCGYDFFDELNRRCPKCGKRLPMGSDECVHCANKKVKVCSNCGYENEEEYQFCIECGTELEE